MSVVRGLNKNVGLGQDLTKALPEKERVRRCLAQVRKTIRPNFLPDSTCHSVFAAPSVHYQ